MLNFKFKTKNSKFIIITIPSIPKTPPKIPQKSLKIIHDFDEIRAIQSDLDHSCLPGV